MTRQEHLSATPPAQSTSATQEIRFALSMSGGLALAVWMGGVSAELYELIRSQSASTPKRADASTPSGDSRTVYKGLLDLTWSTARADVIAGTSAGGLNGAVLAFAIANGAPSILPFRSLWIQAGGFDRLLRPINVKEPPSLLQGDEYFLPEVVAALSRLVGETAAGPAHPIELTMTTTVLDGNLRQFVDSHEVDIVEVDHHGRFEFRHPAPQKPTDSEKDRARSAQRALQIGDAEQTKDDIIHRLGLAARSSASFPAAFEASFIPSRSDEDGDPLVVPPDRRDMTGPIDFGRQGSRYVADGGILMNRPLAPVVEAIFRMKSESAVRRILLLVVPDPANPKPARPDRFEDPPALADVALKAILEIPRNQSLGGELGAIEDHNSAVRDRGRLRRSIAELPDIEGAATAVLPIYRQLRASRSVDLVVSTITGTPAASEAIASIEDIRDALTINRIGLLPTSLVPSPPGGRPWHWGISTLRRIGTNILALCNDLMAAIGPNSPLAVTVSGIKDAIHFQLARLDEIRRDDDDYWLGRWSELAEQSTDLNVWAGESYEFWPGLGDSATEQLLRQADLLQRELEMAQDFARLGMTLKVLTGRALQDGALFSDTHLERVDAFVPRPALVNGVLDVDDERPLSAADSPVDIESVVRRFLAIDVLELMSHPDLKEQHLELIEVSSRSEGALRGSVEPEEKVASIQLGHFGGFLKRSWRANDWMWGRLDGAARYVRILLDPNRLRQVYGASDSSEVTDAILELCFGDKGGAEPRRHSQWLRGQADDGFESRVAAMVTETLQPGSRVRRLEEVEKAVLRRLELNVVEDELPHVVTTVESDVLAGASLSTEAFEFLHYAKKIEERDEADAQTLVDAFEACHIGREKVADEIGTDYLTKVASQSLGVGVSAAQGVAGKLGPVKTAVKILRGLFLSLYWLARGSIASSQGKRFVSSAIILLFVAGGVMLAASILTQDRSLLTSVVGLTILATALAWTFLRAWRPKPRSKKLTVLVPMVVALLAGLAGILNWVDRDASLVFAGGIVWFLLLWFALDLYLKPPTALGLLIVFGLLTAVAGLGGDPKVAYWLLPLSAGALVIWLIVRLVPLTVAVPLVLLATTILAVLPFQAENLWSISNATVSRSVDLDRLEADGDRGAEVKESVDELKWLIAEGLDPEPWRIEISISVPGQPPRWIEFLDDNAPTLAAVIIALGFTVLGMTGTTVKRRLEPLVDTQKLKREAVSRWQQMRGVAPPTPRPPSGSAEEPNGGSG